MFLTRQLRRAALPRSTQPRLKRKVCLGRRAPRTHKAPDTPRVRPMLRMRLARKAFLVHRRRLARRTCLERRASRISRVRLTMRMHRINRVLLIRPVEAKNGTTSGGSDKSVVG